VSDAGPVTHTAATTAADAPTVLDVELEADRVLARVDQGDVSVLVEAPVGISDDELEAVLEEVPTRLERTVALFDRGEQ
jgi:predicted metal-dependent hydrolase